MYVTVAIFVGLLSAIPALMIWLVRPRKEVRSSPFPQNDQVASSPGVSSGGIDASRTP